MPRTTDLTEAEVNHFFNAEIGILGPTLVKLREEGIERPEHLVEFNSDDAKGVAAALRKPGGLVSSSASATVSMIPAPGARIRARALVRLEAAIEMMKHGETLNHKPTADQLRCDHVTKNFKLEFDTLKHRKKKEMPTPLMSQKLDAVR